ncbi:unnamed protein product [Cuscuta campestris]|uniref:Uncharacterized protein n=1 Tax=Cuscuta campestris TaxID=132261 RepID=A0A484MN70_9ASTE|nr:unnamed protein product [Cuscuta campestris]
MTETEGKVGHIFIPAGLNSEGIYLFVKAINDAVNFKGEMQMKSPANDLEYEGPNKGTKPKEGEENSRMTKWGDEAEEEERVATKPSISSELLELDIGLATRIVDRSEQGQNFNSEMKEEVSEEDLDTEKLFQPVFEAYFDALFKAAVNQLKEALAKKELLENLKKGLLQNRQGKASRATRETVRSMEIVNLVNIEGAKYPVFLSCSNEDKDIVLEFLSGLEGLPLHLFEPNALFSIANLVGLPLQMDSATVDLTRPSVARVCVELDLTKDMPKAVWIHLGQLSFLQPITYEDLPEYCISCRAIGHKKCKTHRKSSRWFRREGKLSSRSLNDSIKVLVPESSELGANSVIAHNAPNHAVDISAAPSFADATFAIPNSSTKTPVSTDALLEGPFPLVQTCSDENEQAKDPTILIGKIQCTKDASLPVPIVAENLLGKDVSIPTDPLLPGPVVAESFLGKDVASPTDPAPPLTVFEESTVLHSPPFVPLPEVVHTPVPLIADSNVPDACDAHSTLRKDRLDGSHDNSVCGDDEIISDPHSHSKPFCIVN